MQLDKNKKNVVFIDMDGVVAEYRFTTKEERYSGSYYLNSRPISNNINYFKKLSTNNNVELVILSQCKKESQKDEKIKWLKVNMPFIKKDNIIIIVKEKIVYDDKQTLKAEYIKSVYDKKNVYYLIDDTHEILLNSKKLVPELNIVHVSAIME